MIFDGFTSSSLLLYIGSGFNVHSYFAVNTECFKLAAKYNCILICLSYKYYICNVFRVCYLHIVYIAYNIWNHMYVCEKRNDIIDYSH